MFSLLGFIREMLIFAGYMNSGSSFPEPLSKAEEAKLFILCYEKNDEQARAKLIEHNLRLVSHIAKKYIKTGVESDELISIGAIGLVKAVSTFKPEKGSLSAYASRCIDNEIRMFLRSERKHSTIEVSLEEPVGRDSDGNEVTIGDRLSSEAEDVEEKAFRHVFRERLETAIENCLDERERRVIELRYNLTGKKPLTQREVAKQLNVSRSYVSRIEKKALSKLNKVISKNISNK